MYIYSISFIGEHTFIPPLPPLPPLPPHIALLKTCLVCNSKCGSAF